MGSEFAPKAPVSAPKAQERTGPEVGAAEESGPGNAALVSQAGLSGAPPPAAPPNGIGDPAPIVSYLQAAVSMGKGDWIVGKLLPVVSKGDMKTIADAYGDGFSQDINATLTTDQYAVLRGRLIGVMDPMVDLGRRSTWRLGGDLEGVKSTIDDLTPDQLLAFRRDPASLLVFEAKISEVLGGSSLLGNDDLTFEAKRYLDARLASVKDPEAKVGTPDPVAEARYRTAVQRVKGALAAWVGSGPNDALAAIADLDASQRDRMWRDVLSSAFFPDAGTRIVFDQACHAESEAQLVTIVAGFTHDTGGADEVSDRVTVEAAGRVAARDQGTAEMRQTVGQAYGARALGAAGATPVEVAIAQLPDLPDMDALFDLLDSLGPMDRIALTDGPEFEARRKELAGRATDGETLEAYLLNPSDADAQLQPESPEVILALSHVERAYARGDWARVIALLDSVDPRVRAVFKDSDRAHDLVHQMICNGDVTWGGVLGPTLQNGDPLDLATAREVADTMKGDQAATTEAAARLSGDSATLRASYVEGGDEWGAARGRLGDMDDAEAFAEEDALLGAANPLAADPEQEVRFLRKRLGARLGVEGDVNLLTMQSFSWEGVVEEVTEFYRLDAELGADKYDNADLSALILQYGEATRALDALAGAKDQLASIASNVAAAVAAGVVIAATGGAAAPEVVVALAALSGGAAASAAGRMAEGSTRSIDEMGKDALVGSVNGALAALGAPLASKLVKGASTFGILAGDAAESGGGGLFAGLIETSIDGAFGGAGGSMLDTAVDRATWDRSISEVIARFVIAAASGALFGAAGGALGGAIGHGAGALATVAKERGPAVVAGLTKWCEDAGVPVGSLFGAVSEEDADALVTVWRLYLDGRTEDADAIVKGLGLDEATKARLGTAWRDGQGLADHPNAVLASPGDALAIASAWVKPQGGEFLVFAHGAGGNVVVYVKGAPTVVSPEELAGMLKGLGWNDGQPIRLVSCGTGRDGATVGGKLSKELGVDVYAPSDIVYVRRDGTLSVGTDPEKETGGWTRFGKGEAPSHHAEVSERSADPTAVAAGEESEGNARGLWEGAGPGTGSSLRAGRFGTFSEHESTGLWWSRDNAGHGGSAWKVFEARSDGLHWIADADEFGDFIPGKHKGPTGLFIPWSDLH